MLKDKPLSLNVWTEDQERMSDEDFFSKTHILKRIFASVNSRFLFVLILDSHDSRDFSLELNISSSAGGLIENTSLPYYLCFKQ